MSPETIEKRESDYADPIHYATILSPQSDHRQAPIFEDPSIRGIFTDVGQIKSSPPARDS